MMDFNRDVITIRYYSDSWGPFVFDFTDALPDGETLSSVTVRSFLGRVKSSTDILSLPESTNNLVDIAVIDGNSVGVKLQYPGAAFAGNHSLVFEIQTSSGGKHAFFFYKVDVE